jgi:Wnt-binding factor required for Wnt secretion
MALYVIHFLKVEYDPSQNKRTPYGPSLMVFIIINGILLGLYLLFYLFTLIRNFVYFCSLTPRARYLFLFSQSMLLVMIFTFAFGVYSPLYSNGSIFVFFNALCNLYVWALIYLNWPMNEDLYEQY